MKFAGENPFKEGYEPLTNFSSDFQINRLGKKNLDFELSSYLTCPLGDKLTDYSVEDMLVEQLNLHTWGREHVYVLSHVSGAIDLMKIEGTIEKLAFLSN